MLAFIIVVVIIIAVVAFSTQNATLVTVSFLTWHFGASLALVIVLSLLSGIVIGMALLSLLRLRRSMPERRKTADAGNATPINPDRS